MTALQRQLLQRIRAAGPMSLADYMAECLLNPKHGYYATRDPFGAAGDFVTAPEISQMFGELIGLWLAQCWLDQGRPAPFVLAELGPGRGTLMADLCRAAGRVPGFLDAAQIVLVEASPTLRQAQKKTLAGHEVDWADTVSDLPEGPLFLVANEFFDALPIRQFERGETGWREIMVGAEGDRLIFGKSPETGLEMLESRLADTRPGQIVETCAPAAAIMRQIADRIATEGGVALVVDYGGWHSLGDTLQALRNHRPEHPLASPGEADLTAHVDFEALARAATACAHTPLTGQGAFLERLGITERARQLLRNLTGNAAEAHIAAHRRLTHPDEMGTLFKAMAFHRKDAPRPPGFAP